MEEEEIWKPVVGYKGLYSVSSLGRVRSEDRYVYHSQGYIRFCKGVYLKEQLDKDGYLRVWLYKDGKSRKRPIHRLVAEAFIPNPDNLPMINHKSEIRTQNNVENLEYCDAKYNSNYGNCLERRGKSRSRQVNQYTLEGKFVQTFDSINDAANHIKVNPSMISMVLHGRYQTTKGFIFRFASNSNGTNDIEPYIPTKLK